MRAHEEARVVNAMTVDVEDYFQVEALSGSFPRTAWDGVPRQIEGNIDCLLDMFAAASASATFFTLGWLAERHPAMVRRIAAAGHELASHGYDHRRADRLTPAQLREDVRRSKGLIEDISGVGVQGYRAPTFSIGPANPWSYENLESEGFRYSSSVYPIRHDLYGSPNAPRYPFRPRQGGLWESRSALAGCSGATIPAPAAAIFDCCRIASRAATCVGSTPPSGSPVSSIFIPGRSMRGSRTCMASSCALAFAITRTSRPCGGALNVCSGISAGDEWTRFLANLPPVSETTPRPPPNASDRRCRLSFAGSTRAPKPPGTATLRATKRGRSFTSPAGATSSAGRSAIRHATCWPSGTGRSAASCRSFI